MINFQLRVVFQLWLLFICYTSTVTADFIISTPTIPVDRLAFQGDGSISTTEIVLALAQTDTVSLVFYKETQNVMDGFKAAVLYNMASCDATQGYLGGDGFTFFFTTSNSTTDYITSGGTFGLFNKKSIAMVGLDFWLGRVLHKATDASAVLSNSFNATSFPSLQSLRCQPNPLYVQLEYTPPLFRLTSNATALDVSITMNLNDYFAPSTKLYVGLSASTGNAYMRQSFTYWEFTGNPPAEQVIPVLECYEKKHSSYVAYMGYNNPTTSTLTYEIGATNQFEPAPQDRGQPTVFASGRSPFAFNFEWDGSAVTWTLSSNFVQFSGTSTAHLCPAKLNIEIVFGTTAQLNDGQISAILQSIAKFVGVSPSRVTLQSLNYSPAAKRANQQAVSQGTLELEIGASTNQTQSEPSAAEAVQKFVESASSNTTAVTEVLNPPGVDNIEFISTNPKSTGVDGTGTLITAETPTVAQTPIKTSAGISNVISSVVLYLSLVLYFAMRKAVDAT